MVYWSPATFEQKVATSSAAAAGVKLADLYYDYSSRDYTPNASAQTMIYRNFDFVSGNQYLLFVFLQFELSTSGNAVKFWVIKSSSIIGEYLTDNDTNATMGASTYRRSQFWTFAHRVAGSGSSPITVSLVHTSTGYVRVTRRLLALFEL